MNRHLLRLIVVSIALVASADALEIAADGLHVTVSAGEHRIGGRTVVVKQAVTFAIAPAPLVVVTNEELRLSPKKPIGYSQGTRLRGPNARDVNAFNSFVPGSLELRRTPGGELLRGGEDYLVDEGWGHLGIGPQSRVTTNDTVFASYRYSLQRLDTIQVAANGVATLKRGEPHISAPVPPEPDAGAVAIAHVWIPHRATVVSVENIFLVRETPVQAVTRSTPGRIPKTMAKLYAGEPLNIVCWGDSVTSGGNASQPKFCYVDVFVAGLRERFPNSTIEVENISVPGSNSRQWLYHPAGSPADVGRKDFNRVLAAKPDLVTIEFVNDAELNPQQVEEVYSDILKRLEPLGAEVILITPHFTMLKKMGFVRIDEPERRPYVLALREFADRHRVALADAAGRWEHLWKEGVPYLTLLHNTINHPDDRGHRLFAEELWKCFE